MAKIEEILDTILKHEGGYQDDAEDHGNMYKGQNLGTNYGITPSVLAEHRGTDVTKDDMLLMKKSEARDIYRKQYVVPILKMNPPKEAIPQLVDMAVNHGPRGATKLLQRTIGTSDDGVYGPVSAKAMSDYEGDLNSELVDTRKKYYEDIITSRPQMEKYRNGWNNRAESYRVGQP